MKSYLFEHMLKDAEKSVWLMFKAVCLNFLWNVKTKHYKELVEDLLNAYQTMGCNMSLKIHFSLPIGLLPSKPEHSEWWTWGRVAGRVAPRYFHHGEKIHRKVITEHVSWLLFEPYWRGVYCQLQMNELQKAVLNISKIKHLLLHFCCLIARSYFHTVLLPMYLNFLLSLKNEEVILNHRTQLYNCRY
jgi:hypothetical protein